MSLSNPLPRGTRASPVYVGDGATTVFGVPFWFVDANDLLIVVTTAGVAFTYAAGAGYIATGAGQTGGGTVTLATAPAAGALVQVLGHRVPNRSTSVVNGGDLISAALETELDIETATMQELRRDVDAALAASSAAVAASGNGWRPQGAWSALTTYGVNAFVSYGGGSWLALAPSLGLAPGTNPALWMQITAPGATGATGPSGSGVTGQSTLNFGAWPGTDTARAVISDAGVLATSTLLAQLDATPSADHSLEEHVFGATEMDLIAGAIVPGSGFTVYAQARDAALYGVFNFNWRRI